jgi:hypothetical protein
MPPPRSTNGGGMLAHNGKWRGLVSIAAPMPMNGDHRPRRFIKRERHTCAGMCLHPAPWRRH